MLRVFVVFEYLPDGQPIHGVFKTKRAAVLFAKLKKTTDRLADFGVEPWKIETLEDVQRKWKTYRKSLDASEPRPLHG